MRRFLILLVVLAPIPVFAQNYNDEIDRFFALYARQPVRMEFQFYRPKDEWIIYSFAFDINFDHEIEQGARAQIAGGS